VAEVSAISAVTKKNDPCADFMMLRVSPQCTYIHVKEMYRKKCTERNVQKEMYRKKCTERNVQKEMYRKKCTERNVQKEMYVHVKEM
jgi:hypothetical protein